MKMDENKGMEGWRWKWRKGVMDVWIETDDQRRLEAGDEGEGRKRRWEE